MSQVSQVPRAPRETVRKLRPAWPGELAVILGLLVAYDRVANMAALRVDRAVTHGQQILGAERALGLSIERGMDQWLAGTSWLRAPASLYYDLAHLSFTIAALVAVYLFRPAAYRQLRSSLLALNLLGLAVFLVWPVAPPRLVPGSAFVDIVATSQTWGSIEASERLASHANQYASLPSLHVAWALWTALALATLSRRRWVRGLAVAHVALTVVIVLATGNHYVVDVAAGAVVLLVATRVVQWGAVPVRRTADAPARPVPSVLIISASMGAGHDGVAYELERRLQAAGARTEVVDYLQAMPAGTGWIIKAVYAGQLRYAPATYEWLYAKLDTVRWMEVVASFIAGWGRHSIRRTIRRNRHTLAVSTYPLGGQALGQLRHKRRIGVPAVTFLTDLDVHRTWLDDDTDLYLAVYEGSAREATRRTGCPAMGVGPVLPAAFRSEISPQERLAARAGLGMDPAGPPVVLVVTGSWGVGDVASTVAAIADSGVGSPVVLCGRNEALREELAAGGRCTALGWTSDVRSVLAAADVVVHNAGGLSSLEAFAIGVPVIGHACLPGHGQRNAQAMADAGVAGLARDNEELVGLLRRYAGTDEGRAMAARARELFHSDPTGLLMELASGAEIPDVVPATARHAAAVPAADPVRIPAPRRRVPAWALRAATVLTVIPVGAQGLSLGVALATEHGLGVARAPKSAVPTVYVAALLDGANVQEVHTGDELKAYGVSALIPGQLALTYPQAVRRLSNRGVAVLAADERPRGHDPRRAREVLDAGLRAVREATGERQPPVVVQRRLSPVDLGLAWGSDARLGRPDVVVRPGSPAAVDDRDQVVLDLRGLTLAEERAALAAFAQSAVSSGLSVRPWAALWTNLA